MAKQTTMCAEQVLSGVLVRPMTEIELSEKEILIRVRQGDRQAFQGIVKCYMQTAYYIALGFVHNQQDALDISQDAFVRAFRKIKQFDTEKRFFPWFYRILRSGSFPGSTGCSRTCVWTTSRSAGAWPRCRWMRSMCSKRRRTIESSRSSCGRASSSFPLNSGR